MTSALKAGSYTSASIGVIFLLLAVISRVYSYEYIPVTNEPSTGLQIAYPYQMLSVPLFYVGLVFLFGGIAGFWATYFKEDHKPQKQKEPMVKRINRALEYSPYKGESEKEPTYPQAENECATSPQPPSPIKQGSNTAKRNLSYMLFALGALLLIVGIYLSTYSTVEMVNQPVSIPFVGTINVPKATQVYPYQGIGIISILCAFGCIVLALYQIKEAI